jgi:insertion element IS1 protein InsB
MSINTVPHEFRKKAAVLELVNTTLLHTVNPDEMIVHIQQASPGEMDETRGFVDKNSHRRWLWHAINHHTGAD